jgi:hypothetical protein
MSHISGINMEYEELFLPLTIAFKYELFYANSKTFASVQGNLVCLELAKIRKVKLVFFLESSQPC